MKHALRAFRYRNYRLFFYGQSLSIIGNWIQQVAMSWLVLPPARWRPGSVLRTRLPSAGCAR